MRKNTTKGDVGLGDVQNTEPAKHSRKFIVLMFLMILTSTVILSEIIISQRTGTSLNAGILSTIIDAVLSVLFEN